MYKVSAPSVHHHRLIDHTSGQWGWGGEGHLRLHDLGFTLKTTPGNGCSRDDVGHNTEKFSIIEFWKMH